MTARLGIFAVGLAIIMSANLSGCGYINQSQYAQQERPDYGRIGLVTARFQPDVNTSAAISGKGEGAAKGAGAGVLATLQVPCLYMFYPPAIAVCYAGFATIFAGTGAIQGTIKTESAEKISKSEAFIKTTLGDYQLQDCILDPVVEYAKQVELPAFTVLKEQGPRDVNSLPSYHPVAGSPVNTILELSVINLSSEIEGKINGFALIKMDFRARLIKASDGKILEELTRQFELRMSSQSLSDFDAESLTTLVQSWYREFAVIVIDDMILNYRPGTGIESATQEIKKPDGEEKSGIILDNRVLQPIYPELRSKFLHPRAYGYCEYVQVNEIEPTFRWEALPRILKGAAEKFRITDLKYDVRVFKAEYFGGAQIHEVTGLTEPKYKPAGLFQPCGYYFWTVRARFLLDGKRQATEWSGRYYNWGQEPWWERRNAYPPGVMHIPNSAYYLPFRIPPSSPVERCP